MAAAIASDLELWHKANPVRFCYLPCSGQLFGMAWSVLAMFLGALTSTLVRAGYMPGIGSYVGHA